MRSGIMILLAAILGGCASAPTVHSGGRDYKIVSWEDDKSYADTVQRVRARVDPINYKVIYTAMFDSAGSSGVGSTVDAGKFSAKSAVGKANLATSAIGLSQGYSLGGYGAFNLGFSLIMGTQEDRMVKVGVIYAYNSIVDGSVIVAKIHDGLSAEQALLADYGQLRELLVQDCGFKERDRFYKLDKDDIRMLGPCKQPKSDVAVEAAGTSRYSVLKDAHPDGAIVYTTFSGEGRTEIARMELGDRLRKALPNDWYVIQAISVGKDANGNPAKKVMVFRNGQIKAFDPPPKPEFK